MLFWFLVDLQDWILLSLLAFDDSSFLTFLQILKDGLSAVHVPYAYGFAIILLTVIVKIATFPLTKKQVGFVLTLMQIKEFQFAFFYTLRHCFLVTCLGDNVVNMWYHSGGVDIGNAKPSTKDQSHSRKI